MKKEYPFNKPFTILPTDLQALEYELYIDEEMNRCECTDKKLCYNCKRKEDHFKGIKNGC